MLADGLFATMHKRQADMERFRRECRQRSERAFSSGRSGVCPQCEEYVVGALAVFSDMVCGMEGIGGGLFGSSAR